MSERAGEPIRTCVGCRARAPKASLVRVVATAGAPRIDEAGSAPGRGAYLHRDAGCTATARRSGALGRALRTSLGDDEVGRLMLEIERMGAA